MSRTSLNPIANTADYSADASPANPVLFEEGDWRLYGHLDDEYSTMAHKCPNWAKDGNWSHREDSDEETEWRWYWGQGPCERCHKMAPEDIQAIYTLHNFDRMAAISRGDGAVEL